MREWENWDHGNVAKIIDDIWSNREADWRKLVSFEMKKYLNKESDILDVGCGGGLLCADMIKYDSISPDKYTGGDVTKNFLEMARARLPQVDFKELDILNLPYKDKERNNVMCISVLQHLPGYEEAFKELFRVTYDKLYIITWFNLTEKDDVNFKNFEKFENQSFYSNAYSLPKFISHVLLNYGQFIENLHINSLDGDRNYEIYIKRNRV